MANYDFDFKFEQRIVSEGEKFNNGGRLTRLEAYRFVGRFSLVATRNGETKNVLADAYVRWSDAVLGTFDNGSKYTCDYLSADYGSRGDFDALLKVLHDQVRKDFLATGWWSFVNYYNLSPRYR